MVYHFEFDIAALILTIFMAVLIFFKKGLVRHANRVFLSLIGLIFLSELADIFSSIYNNSPSPSTVVYQDLWNYLYLFAHNALAYCFMVYLFFLMEFVKKKKVAMFILSIPFAVDVILLVLNPFTKWVFLYDENGHYVHGPLFVVLYSIAFLYMVFSIIFVIQNHKYLEMSKTASLMAFLFISFVPVIVQIFVPEYLLTLFFETIGLLGILFSIENKDDTISPVTGIFNRFALESALDTAMDSEGYTLFLVKIPNLNYYNKMIGFVNMNEILGKISSWLEKEFMMYACYDCGRGHFAVVCDRIGEEEIEKCKKDVLERFEKSWGKGKFSLSFPVQVGVIHLPEDVKTMENLQMIIDAPFDGKESAILDAPSMIAKYERRVLIEQLIDKALTNRSFVVQYQPIWNSHTGKVQSAEALCRLVDDEYGMIPPDEFIPIAEQNGTILEIGRIVFEEVCRFYQEERLNRLGLDYIEVNLSVVQCMDRDLRRIFDEILDRYSLDAKHINLEITESATADNQKALVDTIDTLRERGFTFSLDDYGTGYSNISYMYEMPFSIIKVDKSILWKAMDPKTGTGQKSAITYLENTIRMLRDMEYSVLVEGVETMEQKMLLEGLECDYFQGYYFSKPIQKEVFLDYLRVVNA